MGGGCCILRFGEPTCAPFEVWCASSRNKTSSQRRKKKLETMLTGVEVRRPGMLRWKEEGNNSEGSCTRLSLGGRAFFI